MQNNILKKSLIVGIISILIITTIAPTIIALDTKQKTDGSTKIKNTSINKNGLIDNVHIRVYSTPLIFTLLLGGDAVNLEYFHENNESIEYIYYLNVTKKDGSQLFDTKMFYEKNFSSKNIVSWNFMNAKSFRDMGYPFGFFNVKVDFYVLNDGSSKQIAFHGFIYYLNAVYFDTCKDWK